MKTGLLAAFVLGVLTASPAVAQQPLGQPLDSVRAVIAGTTECPAADPADGRAVELRVGGQLIRAQVGEPSETEDGAGVRVRLVGCEAAAPAAVEAETSAASGLLRLLHDLRVGIDLDAPEDGDCFRATFSIRDAAEPSSPDRRAADRPLAFQLCGLPVPDLRPGS